MLELSLKTSLACTADGNLTVFRHCRLVVTCSRTHHRLTVTVTVAVELQPAGIPNGVRESLVIEPFLTGQRREKQALTIVDDLDSAPLSGVDTDTIWMLSTGISLSGPTCH